MNGGLSRPHPGEGGQLLKSSTKFPGDEVTTAYDYADIKAPL
jgi:hypothetical protein